MTVSRHLKYLCVCQYGHSRSAALVRMFHHIGETAICVGWGTMTNVTWFYELQEDADVICTLDIHADLSIKETERHKIVQMDVGLDVWSNPYHPELLELCKRLITENITL